MQEITLRGPTYTFQCYGVHEAKKLGLIDSRDHPGSHVPVSTQFKQGEGKLLFDWVEKVPDAVLVFTSRYRITVYRPRTRVIEALIENNPRNEKREIS